MAEQEQASEALPERPAAELLQEGAAALGIPLAPEELARYARYEQELSDWNQRMNLTATTDPREIAVKHILDSLTCFCAVSVDAGTRVLDVGTGAGLPGIPLAVVLPDRHFVLLDSSAKKIRFVTQAIAELGLANAQAVQSRVQDFRPVRLFDTVVSRAFASIASMVEAAAHLCSEQGRLLAMKGAYPQAELEAVPAGFKITDVQALRVPGLEDAQRHVVCIEREP